MSGDRHVTFVEVVLRLHGDFRKGLEPLGVTPIQGGAILYFHRHEGV